MAAGKVPAMELATASHHRCGAFRISARQKFRKIAAIRFLLESNAFSLRRSVNGTKRARLGYESEPQLNKTKGVVT
jgi:hypothetical protein